MFLTIGIELADSAWVPQTSFVKTVTVTFGKQISFKVAQL